MKRETAKRLHDAESACAEARQFCSTSARERFIEDRPLQLAVQKLVEALRQAEESDREAVQAIPELRAVVDTRTRLVHGYDRVDFGVLWDIVQNEIPPLHVPLGTLFLDVPDISGALPYDDLD